jgi:ELWxxDGT repeat protein
MRPRNKAAGRTSRGPSIEPLEPRALLVSVSLVRDVNPAGHANVGHIEPLGSTAFFSADDGVHGSELWKSDGTEAGTVLVKDVRPGAESSEPQSLLASGGFLYFTADDGTHGRELWRTDGTDAGTTLVKEVRPFLSDGISEFAQIRDLGGTLFFTSFDGAKGSELWKSDGTDAGTVRVLDTSAGQVGAKMVVVEGAVVFTAGGRLWRSDGTADGTYSIDSTVYGLSPPGFAAAGGRAFFAGERHTLWVTDGTAGGTHAVTDAIPPFQNYPTGIVASGDGSRVYFFASGRRNREYLWRSDGTAAGTVAVKRVTSSAWLTRRAGANVAVVANTLYFTQQGADRRAPRGEREMQVLWKSDGTRKGTRRVGPAARFLGDFTAFNQKLYFVAPDDTGRALWETDGTRRGTHLVQRGISASTSPFEVAVPYAMGTLGPRLLFNGYDAEHGWELWSLAADLPG